MAGTEACHSGAAPKPQCPGTWTVPIGVCHSLWVIGSSLEKFYIYVTSACLTSSYMSAYSHKSDKLALERGQMHQQMAGGSAGGGFWPGIRPGEPSPSLSKGKNQIQKDGPSSVQFCFEMALRFAVQCLSRTLRRLEEALGFSVGLIS